MSGNDANPVFFNKKKTKQKNKDWTSRTLANSPPPYVRKYLIFALPSTLKVDVICVSPLSRITTKQASINSHLNCILWLYEISEVSRLRRSDFIFSSTKSRSSLRKVRQAL